MKPCDDRVRVSLQDWDGVPVCARVYIPADRSQHAQRGTCGWKERVRAAGAPLRAVHFGITVARQAVGMKMPAAGGSEDFERVGEGVQLLGDFGEHLLDGDGEDAVLLLDDAGL